MKRYNNENDLKENTDVKKIIFKNEQKMSRVAVSYRTTSSILLYV